MLLTSSRAEWLITKRILIFYLSMVQYGDSTQCELICKLSGQSILPPRGQVVGWGGVAYRTK